jgi:hypothetical protein
MFQNAADAMIPQSQVRFRTFGEALPQLGHERPVLRPAGRAAGQTGEENGAHPIARRVDQQRGARTGGDDQRSRDSRDSDVARHAVSHQRGHSGSED